MNLSKKEKTGTYFAFAGLLRDAVNKFVLANNLSSCACAGLLRDAVNIFDLANNWSSYACAGLLRGAVNIFDLANNLYYYVVLLHRDSITDTLLQQRIQSYSTPCIENANVSPCKSFLPRK